MDLRQPNRKILWHCRRLQHANCGGLAVVLDELGVVALFGELPAHLFEHVVAGILPRRRAMEHDDRRMRPGSARCAVIFVDWLSTRGELALDPSGVRVWGDKKKNCGRECAAG